MRRLEAYLLVICTIAALATACGEEGGDSPSDGSALRVVTTTTHLADLTKQVAGDLASVDSILPPGADAHNFEPTPGDVEDVADADLVLTHGMKLDEWSSDLVEQAGTEVTVVTVTDGVSLDEGVRAAEDPHIWFDVAYARQMVAVIRDALSAAEPESRATFEANASRYLGELDELDSWIRGQIGAIPPAQRKLVTNHDAFGYFAQAYGVQVVGAVIPSLDTQSQPSAAETAALIEMIEAQGVTAIFTEASIDPDVAEQIAAEAGVEVVRGLYSDSLGEPGSGADTYVGMMRANTTLIVEGLT